jgi:hypothetical protein
LAALSLLALSATAEASPVRVPEEALAYSAALAFIKELNDRGAATASRHLIRDDFVWLDLDGKSRRGNMQFREWAEDNLVGLTTESDKCSGGHAEHLLIEGEHGTEIYMPLTFVVCNKSDGICMPMNQRSIRRLVRFQFEYRPGYLPAEGPPIRRIEVVG